MAQGLIKKNSTPNVVETIFTLYESSSRIKLALTRYREYTLTSGLYALIGETSANNYTGRSFALFRATNNISGYDMMPPTLTKEFDYREHIQFVFVPAGETKQIELMYWDTLETGAKHIWRIIKLISV